MEADFPAAHSMDCTWFAVDRDGHVACFDSGEAGAVPHAAYLEDCSEYLQQLPRSLKRTGFIYDPAGQSPPGAPTPEATHWALHMQAGGSCLLFLDSLAPLQAEITAGRAVQVPATRGAAVILTKTTPELIRQIHDANQCRGCFFYFDWDDRPDAGAYGFYSYGHLCENWISGPYGRQRVPVRPVKLDALPASLRELVGRTRFANVSFAQTTYLQPTEHTACSSWEPASLGSDGRTIRPIPDNVTDDPDAFRKAVEQMREGGSLEGYLIEPPLED